MFYYFIFSLFSLGRFTMFSPLFQFKSFTRFSSQAIHQQPSPPLEFEFKSLISSFSTKHHHKYPVPVSIFLGRGSSPRLHLLPLHPPSQSFRVQELFSCTFCSHPPFSKSSLKSNLLWRPCTITLDCAFCSSPSVPLQYYLSSSSSLVTIISANSNHHTIALCSLSLIHNHHPLQIKENPINSPNRNPPVFFLFLFPAPKW